MNTSWYSLSVCGSDGRPGFFQKVEKLDPGCRKRLNRLDGVLAMGCPPTLKPVFKTISRPDLPTPLSNAWKSWLPLLRDGLDVRRTVVLLWAARITTAQGRYGAVGWRPCSFPCCHFESGEVKRPHLANVVPEESRRTAAKSRPTSIRSYPGKCRWRSAASSPSIPRTLPELDRWRSLSVSETQRTGRAPLRPYLFITGWAKIYT